MEVLIPCMQFTVGHGTSTVVNTKRSSAAGENPPWVLLCSACRPLKANKPNSIRIHVAKNRISGIIQYRPHIQASTNPNPTLYSDSTNHSYTSPPHTASPHPSARDNYTTFSIRTPSAGVDPATTGCSACRWDLAARPVACIATGVVSRVA
jgi:hypothetical protein